jgi:hypothetical protein
MAPDKRRIQIPDIGLYYEDLLIWDSAINERSMPVQAQSLLCAKLQEREPKINERLEYISEKIEIPVDEIKIRLRNGEKLRDMHN